MKKRVLKTLLPYNLQFFATDITGNESNDSGGDEPDDNGDEPDDGGESQKEKTFTQSEVNKMMAREKKQGRRSVLKDLGFSNEEEAKKAYSLLNALMDSQKSEGEKNNETNKKLEDEKSEAEKRAELAEAKLTCLENGVNKDSIEDVLSIAMSKIDEKTELEDVIKNMKKEKRYSVFFEESNDSNNDGTGNPTKNTKKKEGSEVGSIGKRLASSYKPAEKKKSSFFE